MCWETEAAAEREFARYEREIERLSELVDDASAPYHERIAELRAENARLVAAVEEQAKALKHLRCPACGHAGAIFVGDGGYLTCGIAECPNPDYADAVAKLVEAVEEREGKTRETCRYPGECLILKAVVGSHFILRSGQHAFSDAWFGCNEWAPAARDRKES